MNHEQFVETYLRTPQDVDGDSTYQCVDLAKLYSKVVLGIKLGSFGGTALSGWKNSVNTFDPKFWERVDYRFPYAPEQGNIVFYSEPAGTGHVAIAHSATVKHVTLLEQNGATGNGKGQGYDAINFEVKRDFKKCLGWYRKK